MSELKTNLEQILQEKNEKIISQNIKKDVEVLGVTGSYDKEDIKELQDELADAEQELADVRRDLDNSTVTISGSGENVTLNGTAEARFKKAPLPLGNTEQEVIEAQAGTTVEGESISASGVDLSKVEILNVNGNTKQQTTTGTNLIGLDTNQYKVNLSAGDKLTITNNTAEETIIDLYSNYGDTQRNDWFSFAANSVRTVTLAYDAKAFAWRKTVNGIAWCNSGETALPYELYTGGKASPNPDYPQEMYNAGTNINLLDISQVMIGKAWNNASNSARAVVYMKCDPSTTYTISFNNISNFDGVYNFEKTSPEDTTAIVGVSQITTTKTITTNANSSYLGIQFNKSSVSASDFIGLKIKIEKGDKATAYSEYNQGNMNVEISNKNLWNGELEQNAWNNSDGTTTVWSNQYIRSKSFIEVKSNTIYTLNYSMLNNEVKNGNILLYDKDKNFINSLQTPNNLTFTTSSTTKYLKFNFYAGAGASVEGMSNLQIEQGSTATTYVAHEGQSFIIPTQAPFRKINSIKDTFVKKVDGKWYEKHVIGEVILDGSESGWSITTRSDGTTKFFARTYVNEILTNNTSASNELSNYFIVGNPYTSIEDKIWLFKQGNNTTLRIGFKDQETITTVSEFKAWLSIHNVIVNYPLAEPTYIECTQEQSDILDQINTFYETTNIFSTDEVSPNFTFTYNKVYASPSPDDESPIQTVSGDVEVKVQNKNFLINPDIIADSTGNATYENGVIKTGALNGYNWVKYMINQNPIILPAGNYTLAWKMKYVSGTPSYCSVIQFNNDLSGYIQTTLTRTSTTTVTTEYKQYYATVTLDTNLEVGNIFFQVAYNSSSAIYNIKDIMILKGTYTESTVPDYITHKEQVLPLTLKSKNLFDKTRIVSTNQGNWEVVQITDGVRIIHKNSYYTGTPSVVFKLKPNTTYTYSQNEAAGYSIQPDGGTKQYANTNQMTIMTRTFRNINYRICCS